MYADSLIISCNQNPEFATWLWPFHIVLSVFYLSMEVRKSGNQNGLLSTFLSTIVCKTFKNVCGITRWRYNEMTLRTLAHVNTSRTTHSYRCLILDILMSLAICNKYKCRLVWNWKNVLILLCFILQSFILLSFHRQILLLHSWKISDIQIISDASTCFQNGKLENVMSGNAINIPLPSHKMWARIAFSISDMYYAVNSDSLQHHYLYLLESNEVKYVKPANIMWTKSTGHHSLSMQMQLTGSILGKKYYTNSAHI